MTLRRIVASLAVLLAIALVAAAPPTIAVTGQLLAYQDGFVFFTTGDGFKAAPDLAIRSISGGPTTLVPAPRVWARAHFDPSGSITELDLSRDPLPQEGSFGDVARFAVALSSPVPNPDLAAYATPPPGGSLTAVQHFSGRPVLVTFVVQVPPNTALNASVYMTTDASGWNPQAIPMDRIDALHYGITRRLNSGTIFRYLYDRGSFQSQESAENGLQRAPRQIVVTDADVRVIRDTVFAWNDTLNGTFNQQPNAAPTPYNPGPFPNLPHGFPTPGVPGRPPR